MPAVPPVPLCVPVIAFCGHSVAVTLKVPSEHLIVAVVPGAIGPVVVVTQAVPSQYEFIPHPPTGGIGAIFVAVIGTQEVPSQKAVIPQPPGGGPVVVVVVGALGAQEFPFQKVFIPQPPGGGVGAVGAVVVGLGAQEFPFQNVFIAQPPGGGVGPVGAGAVGQFWSSGIVNDGAPLMPAQVFAEAAGIERFPKTTRRARSSDEAVLKRFITSSKAGHLG